MIDSFLLESIVSNWLSTAAKELFQRTRKTRWADVELRSPDGKRTLVEIKARPPAANVLQRLADQFRADSDASTRFVLLTEARPTRDELSQFKRAFGADVARARWLTLDEFPAFLGKPSPGDWRSPKTWAQLQTSALIKGLDEYKDAPIGPAPEETAPATGDLQALARQFSYKAIGRLKSSSGSLETTLGLGTRRENVTVVLSDLVNFSSLVTASRPEDIRQAMGQYYRRSREAVFDHEGMLDKFIGDAVLAVFGFPEASKSATTNAIKFAQSLIQIGREITQSWQADLNAVISSGTRIGIASGDLWPINIAQTGIEISLLGDTINLAARLEKNCGVDRFLIDNRTHTAVSREDGAFVETLGLQQLVIPAADAKGQAFPIRAWTQS